MEKKLRSFFESNYLLFENQETETEDDPLSEKMVNSLIQKGIVGLDEFESFFTPRKYKQLKNSISEIFKKHEKEARVSFFHFIKNYLNKYKILNEEDFHSQLILFLIRNLVQSLDDFNQEIELEKIESLKEKLNSFEGEPDFDFKDIESFFSYLLKTNKISDDEDIIRRISKRTKECFVGALEHFKEDISPKNLELIIASLSLISNSTDSPSIKEPIQNANIPKNIEVDLKKLREDFEEIPVCAEKSILSLIFYLTLKLQKKSSGVIDLSYLGNLDEIIDKEFELLMERLIIEELDVRLSLENAKSKRKLKEWTSTIKELEKLLKIIRPLNISDLKNLINNAKNAAEKINNQDIILLLGGTGAGKSTTVHFLAGSKMIESEVQIELGKTLKHITPVEPYRCEDLKNVTISSRAESETRYISAVKVNFSIFADYDRKSTIICDTPGFEDNRGCEVDIANGVGVLEALKGCKSVKPVILISYLAVGDRGQGIKKIAHLLVRMINNIEDHLDCFSYVFTKFPSNVGIHNMLLNIKKTSVDVNPEESEDVPFNALFCDILDKTKNAKSLDPINHQPYNLLKDLTRSASIQNPKSAFNFSLTDNSRMVVNEQVRLNQLNIISAIKRGEYELADRNLVDLKYLKETIKEDYIEGIFESCVQYIETNVGEEFSRSKDELNRSLENCIKLNIEDVNRYKRQIEKFKRLEFFKSFRISARFSEALITNLENKVKYLLEIVEGYDLWLNIRDIKIILDNVKLIGQNFKEAVSFYEKICDWKDTGLIYRKLSVINDEIGKNLPLNDFTKVAQKLRIVLDAKKFFADHVNLSKLNEMYQNLVQQVKEHLENALKNADSLLNKEEKLSKIDIEKLQSFIETIENANVSIELRDHIEKKLINEIYDSFFTRVVTYFEKLGKKIEDLFKLEPENYFKKVEGLVLEMDDLRTIPLINTKTSEVYQSKIQRIIFFVHQLKLNAESILDQFYRQSDNVDYTQLYRCMNVLKSAEWVNDFKEGVYEDIMKNVHDDLLKYSRNLYDDIIDLNLNLENYSNLENVNKLFTKLEKMKPLESNFQELVQYRENAQKKIKDSLEKNILFIKENFDLKKQSINEESNMLKFLEKIRDEYNSFLPSRIYLKTEGFANEIALNDGIEKTRSEIKINESTANRLDQKLKRMNSILKEYAVSNTNKKGVIKNENILEGYKDISSLADEIKNCENEIEFNKNSMSKNLERLNSLETIKRKHSGINDNSLISQESKEYLEKYQFKDLNKLEEELATKRKLIQDYESIGLRYTFSQLDLNVADNSLYFLLECQSIRSIRDTILDSFTLKIDLETFLKEYKIYIEKMMNFYFEKIQNLPTNDTHMAFSFAHKLKSFISELKDLEKFKALDGIIKSSELLKRWKEKVSTNLIDLRDQLDKDEANKRDLKSKLNIVKALVQLDDKYSELYSEYRKTINAEFKEYYKKINEYSENREYKKVAMELIDIEESPISEKAFSQAMHFLTASITELLAETRTLIVKLTNNLEKDTIDTIVKKFDQLSNARMYLTCDFDKKNQEKFKTKSYLDDETNRQLINGLETFQNSVSNKLLIYLEHIIALIKSNDFFEAEEKKDYYINTVRELLGSYCVTEEINNKFSTIQTSLENSVNTIFEKYDKMPIEKYMLDPPKYTLNQLEKVSKGNYKYTKVLNSARDTIINKLRNELDKAKDATPAESSKSIRIVQSTLGSLPEDIKNMIEFQVKEIEQVIKDRNDDYNSEFNSIMTSHDVKVIQQFIDKCSEKGMNKFLKQISEEIFKRASNLKDEFKNSLENENMKAAIDCFKMLYQYKNAFGQKMSAIDSFFNESNKQLINKFDKIASVLIGISGIEKVEQGEVSFDSFCKIVELKNDKDLEESSQEIEVLLTKISEKLDPVYLNLTEYFLSNQSKFNVSIEKLNVSKLNESMNIMKKWNTLIKKIKRYVSIESDDVKTKKLNKIDEGKSYSQMKDETNMKLKNLKERILKFEPLQRFEKELDNYYKSLEENVLFLKNANDLKEHIDGDIFSESSFGEEILPYLSSLNENMSRIALEILELNHLNRKDFDDLRLNLSNLISFEKFSRSIGLDIKKNIDKINQKIREKTDNLSKGVNNRDFPLENLCENLISMKVLADNIPSHKERIDENIDNVLQTFRNQTKNDAGISLAKLSTLLEKDPTGVGLTIISEHSIFKGQSISLFNQETKRHGIDHVLSHLEGDCLDTEKLRYLFDRFESEYKELIKENITRLEKKSEKEDVLNSLISKIRLLPKNVKQKSNQTKWDENVRHLVPTLMSHIFALWTLKGTEYYMQMKGVEKDLRDSFLLSPHPSQVISIFRILGFGYMESMETTTPKYLGLTKKVEMHTKNVDNLQNNLVQIGTGEGKSVTLAVTSCILALLGISVSCACYSEYLSSRDYQAFLPIFDALGITEFIQYGTFNVICEKIINEKGDVRNRIVNLVSNKMNDSLVDSKCQRPKILLIDEVDVFFSKEFYGNIYTPLARLRDPTIVDLVRYIWVNKTNKLSFRTIEQTQEFKACCQRYKGWEILISEAVKNMLCDVLEYKHDYIVKNDKIGYKEQDGVSFNLVFGYKTLFAYFYENENGNISKSSLDENISIGIRCGCFSYAEIPKKFNFIMGVTGTLKTLSSSEMQIVENVYNIKRKTYMPSVFGENKRKFAKEADVFIENQDDYFITLREKIDNSLGEGKRAVMIFFDTKKNLKEFSDSKHLSPIRSQVQIITEEVSSSPHEKDMLIKRATTAGQVTLLTSVFGRGTDFVCRDQSVILNGGIHVIQTFLSKEYSEEVQIMGRTARQGKDGSYSMVLLDSDLEKYLGTSFKEKIEEMRNNKTTYDSLHNARNAFFECEYKSINENLGLANAEHLFGEKFLESLNNNQIENVKKFLGERNMGASGSNYSRTICLMDATGSMSNLLTQAKNTVGEMFDRASKILKEAGLAADSFQLQFAVYRDYDCKDEVLQYSPWEQLPENLRKFMEKVTARGGGDYEEAIEIGLWHANSEDSKTEVSQVILIGDAPPKENHAIIRDRNANGGENFWKTTPYNKMTHYLVEAENLRKKNIPVHCFYLADGAKIKFEEIAKITNGKCEFLNINTKAGSEVLTNIVTVQILSNIGQTSGKGDELVKAYKEKFSKAYK